MTRFVLVAFLLLCCATVTVSRRDRTQKYLDRHLKRVTNRLALISNATFAHEIFDQFRVHHPHPHHYRSSKRIQKRFRIFQRNLHSIVQSSNASDRTFTVGINKFSDWIPSELEILRGNRPPSSAVRLNFVTANLQPLPHVKQSNTSKSTTLITFDYSMRVSTVNRSISILRPVKDQGQCGSCYAFALISLVEAQYAFQYGQGMNMSEQQIVDCSKRDFGCTGGYFNTAFDYLQGNKWFVNSASAYPYTDLAATNCSAKKTDGWSAGNLVYRHLPSGNATAMEHALVTFGPLWISIYVGSDCSNASASTCPVQPDRARNIMTMFQSYTGGIFQVTGCKTSANNNNHAMVIVGYGHDSKTNLNFWKVRNSWGKGWGEDGYVRIQRGVNMCNVESDAFFIAKPAH